MNYRNTATAITIAAALALTACGGGSDDASAGGDSGDDSGDDSGGLSRGDAPAAVLAAEGFPPPSIDAEAVCAAVPGADVEALFGFSESFFSDPALADGVSACYYTASTSDASIVANVSIEIFTEGGPASFAERVETWEALVEVVERTPGIGDDAITVRSGNGNDSMYILHGERVLEVKASTGGSDKSVVDVLPELGALAVAGL